jgi:glycosyltransferase involved in cell wall biosynthesis
MSESLHIVHLVRRAGVGTGVGAVVAALDGQMREHGVETAIVTVAAVGAHRDPPRGWGASIVRAVEIVWFTVAGSLRARVRYPEGGAHVTISHNDALVGRIHVNHGVLREALRLRPDRRWRVNPLHMFLLARERLRYRWAPHRVIVCLSRADERLLHGHYPRAIGRTRVIPNGVDVARFAVADSQGHAVARARTGVEGEGPVLLFVGHEFDRKGLSTVFEVLALTADDTRLRSAKLLVVGGSGAAIRRARTRASALGIAERVRFAGVADPRDAYAAADVLMLPSRYEASPLVLGEALASGLPFVAGASGGGGDLLADGAVGRVTPLDSHSVANGLLSLVEELRTRGRAEVSRRNREVAERRSWDRIARQYIALAQTVAD